METEFMPTAESILESLAKLLAHQNGGTVENLVITKNENKDGNGSEIFV